MFYVVSILCVLRANYRRQTLWLLVLHLPQLLQLTCKTTVESIKMKYSGESVAGSALASQGLAALTGRSKHEAIAARHSTSQSLGRVSPLSTPLPSYLANQYKWTSTTHHNCHLHKYVSLYTTHRALSLPSIHPSLRFTSHHIILEQ
jgi:hypothetical protein